MGHGKETPRQKMIGMMYLVLTAMLALNVSADILNGFVLVNKGLVKTTENFVAKNASSYSIFEAEMEKTPDKVRPFRDAAFSVKEKADQLAFDLQEAKIKILKYCDGETAEALIQDGWSAGEHTTYEINDALIKAKDNYDKPSEIFVTMGEGDVLKEKIEAFRDFLITLTDDESVKKGITDALNTDGGVDKSGVAQNWQTATFYHMPLVAALTMLSKLQGDVRNAEADIINNLLQQIGATDTKVNKMEAIVQAKSGYILRGNEYEARIILAAYDSLQKPEILIGPYRRTADGTDYEMVGEGRVLQYDARGRAIYKTPGSSVGTFNLQGLLRMVTPEGVKSYPFSSEYQVGEPSAVISATKMNALYIGVDNPIAATISGVPSSSVQFSVSNGTFTKVGNEYMVKPATVGNASIRVWATVEGKTIENKMDFRVRMLPTPTAKVGGKSGGNIDRNTLAGQQGILADMGDFLFDLRFVVTEFSLVIMRRDGERNSRSTSAAFTAEQKALINTLQKGERVLFTGIKARLANSNQPPVDLAEFSLVIN